MNDAIEPFEKPILVTRPFLPTLSEFTAGLEEIWENQWLTNNGPVLNRYTRKGWFIFLRKYVYTLKTRKFNYQAGCSHEADPRS